MVAAVKKEKEKPIEWERVRRESKKMVIKIGMTKKRKMTILNRGTQV